MKTFYKNINCILSFNTTTLMLVTIFDINGSLTFSCQEILEENKDLMISKLLLNNEEATEEEFTLVYDKLKMCVNTI